MALMINMQLIIFSYRLLKNRQLESRSSSSQCRYLHSFQTSLFIATDWAVNFGQNHSRDGFQAFACRHLQSLCCSFGMWADALFSDRSSIYIWCFAQAPQGSFHNMQFVPMPYFTQGPKNQSGGWGSENPLCRPSFKSNFENSGNNTGQELLQF